MHQNISRRNFLAGAGSAALGAATLSLAGCSPTAGTNEDAATSATSGAETPAGRWSWSIPPAPISDDDIAETIDCEVLILGAGSAGVPAALYGASQGANVVVMQKYERAQSNGWSIAAFNTRHDTEFDLSYDAAAIRTKMSMLTNGRANMELICGIIDRSGEALDWLADTMEDEKPMVYVSDATETLDGKPTHLIYFWVNGEDMSTRYDAFEEALDIMVKKSEALGARYLYETPACQLLTDDSGAVIGAVGQNAEGGYIRVNANKGVLLACGDISDDDEMLECYCPTQLGIPRMSPYGTCTGDAHKMALWAGAKLDTPPFCMGTTVSYNGAGVGAFYTQRFLRVNINGERFANEDIAKHPVNGHQPINTADALQPDHLAIQIIDSNFGEGFDVEYLESLVGQGDVFKAGTLEELASAVNLPADALTATVERYNHHAEVGFDEDFGTSKETLEANTVKAAPFYAIRQPVAQMAVVGGVCANKYLEVINERGKPIEGLYAAGNLLGSCYGYEYPWVEFAASNKMHAVAGGMLAVKSMLGTFDSAF